MDSSVLNSSADASIMPTPAPSTSVLRCSFAGDRLSETDDRISVHMNVLLAPGAGHENVKPPGRVADTRLPLACVHPLSRGLRHGDVRDGRGASSNHDAKLFTGPVDASGERLGERRGRRVDYSCIRMWKT